MATKQSRAERAQAQIIEDFLESGALYDNSLALELGNKELINRNHLYCFDNKEGVYHVRKSRCVRHIKPCNRVYLSDIEYEANICPDCYRRAIILQGIKKDADRVEEYHHFFAKHKVPSTAIKKITCGKNGELYLENRNSLRISIPNQDTWIINYSEKTKKYSLYHNNWISGSNGEKIITPGFHIEDLEYDTLEEVLIKIRTYSWAKGHRRREETINWKNEVSNEGRFQFRLPADKYIFSSSKECYN